MNNTILSWPPPTINGRFVKLEYLSVLDRQLPPNGRCLQYTGIQRQGKITIIIMILGSDLSGTYIIRNLPNKIAWMH